jgi:hypothetical protein
LKGVPSLPAFRKTKFTYKGDRAVVRELLNRALRRLLPPRRKYITGVGEWTRVPWSDADLRSAFRKKFRVKTEGALDAPHFDMDLPTRLETAVERAYKINRHSPPSSFWRSVGFD